MKIILQTLRLYWNMIEHIADCRAEEEVKKMKNMFDSCICEEFQYM